MRVERELLDRFPLFPNQQEPDRRIRMTPWEIDSHHLWKDVVPDGLRDGHYNYVIADTKRLVVAKLPMGIGGDDHVGHPVLADFRPVYSAGDFVFEDGRIIEIRDSSGHYQTGEKGLTSAKLIFRLFGAPVREDCKYTLYAQSGSRRPQNFIPPQS